MAKRLGSGEASARCAQRVSGSRGEAAVSPFFVGMNKPFQALPYKHTRLGTPVKPEIKSADFTLAEG